MDDLSEVTFPEMIEALVSEADDEMVSVQTPEDVQRIEGGQNKIGRCILTMFVPNTDIKWLRPQTYTEVDRLTMWCGQFEECPDTERLHIHIYCEFLHAKRLRFAQLREMIENATGSPGDIAIAKKAGATQRQCAINYVLKPAGRMIDTEFYIWPGSRFPISFKQELAKTVNKKLTRKNEKDQQVDWIESKPKHWTWDQILHESDESKKLLCSCSWGPKYHAGRHSENGRRTIADVIVMYGAGGTGKTTLAQKFDVHEDEDFNERYYKRNPDDGKFWGAGRTAYRGQRIIHLEEFCGQETAANFKEICDVGKHGPSVNIKNSGTELNHEKVIITSNHHPAGWYKKLCADDKKQWKPIVRRLTQVWFFPEKREDGTDNCPDENNAPYYIDQTDEFKNFLQEFDCAIEHATTWWPIPEKREFDGDSDQTTKIGKYW